jgi:hypothetical protein
MDDGRWTMDHGRWTMDDGKVSGSAWINGSHLAKGSDFS